MRAGYLGPAGTFSHEALLASEPHAFPIPFATVHDTVVAVQAGEVDVALVPLENSVEGGVAATLDTLVADAPDVRITGEVVQAVTHCLVGIDGTELETLTRVLSHPQATAQCARFLRSELPDAAVIGAPSTAEAVRMVIEEGDPAAAAIGTRGAAGLYGAEVLREGIEDEHDNSTRFVWLGREAPAEPVAPEEARTTLVFWGTGTGSSGWLVRCLSEFAFRGVNLTRIESRPRREAGLGAYMFFVDVDGHAGEPPVRDAVEALRGQADTVRVLGSYRRQDG